MSNVALTVLLAASLTGLVVLTLITLGVLALLGRRSRRAAAIAVAVLLGGACLLTLGSGAAQVARPNATPDSRPNPGLDAGLDSSPSPGPTPVHTAEQQGPPAWIYQRATMDGAYHFPIRVGPYTTPQECEQHLPEVVNQALDEYVAMYLGERARGHIRLPHAFIEERLIRERWYENRPFLVTNSEHANMTVLHVLLSFDSATNEYLKSLWRSVLSMYRVGILMAGFAGVLWLFAVLWAYLKLDQLSAGRYRGRLRAAAVIALLVPPGLLALFFGLGGRLAALIASGA